MFGLGLIELVLAIVAGIVVTVIAT